MARNAVSCGHDDDTGKAFDLLASVVRFPDRHDGIVVGSVPGRPFGWGLAVQSGFAVVMAQVRRPVPFRTRKLRPGTAMVLHSRGCGRVARRRIQRWGFPSSVTLREPFFCFSSGVRFPQRAGGFSCSRSAQSVLGFQREFLLFHKDFW